MLITACKSCRKLTRKPGRDGFRDGYCCVCREKRTRSYASRAMPKHPTYFPRGSAEKIAVMSLRYQRQQRIFHEADSKEVRQRLPESPGPQEAIESTFTHLDLSARVRHFQENSPAIFDIASED